jgi:hypothetical protein
VVVESLIALRVPTILRSGPYRVYFFSHDLNEPMHVHVDRDEKSAKFWLSPLGFARNRGFDARELAAIQRILREHHSELVEAWRGYFRRKG